VLFRIPECVGRLGQGQEAAKEEAKEEDEDDDVKLESFSS
jgi:hypothetical protein